MKTSNHAASLFDQAMHASDNGEILKAIELYEQAATLNPMREATYFNLGVLYKKLTRWPDARRVVDRALELAPNDNEGAWWNLGIIATAQNDWATARSAWRNVGVDLPDEEGPIFMNLGLTPIRLRSADSEVVWCIRIDPARAVIESIPFPSSGHRCGDVLLHDGEPTGVRVISGRQVHVFDELAVLERSSLQTFEAKVVCPAINDEEELLSLATSKEIHAESWSQNVRIICKECSENNNAPPHAHEHPTPAWSTERVIAFAAHRDTDVLAVLEAWVANSQSNPGSRSYLELLEHELQFPLTDYRLRLNPLNASLFRHVRWGYPLPRRRDCCLFGRVWRLF